MRRLLIIVIVLVSLVILRSYADDAGTFGIRLVPNKMIENSSGVLEVYALYSGHIFPTKIQNMAFSSTDSTIVQMVGLEDNDTGFMTHIKIKANNPGTANIVIAAPGFTPQEFPVTVYSDESAPSSLLIKATPSTFQVNGPKAGYFTVELVNNDGLPAFAQTDVPITVATTNGKSLSLTTSHITISKGQYYAVGRFQTDQVGSAKIFASAPSFPSVSTTVTVTSTSALTIQAYVYPTKINNFATSNAYVVAQLKDASGNEAIANEDIPISVMVTNSTATGLVNTSPQEQLIGSNSPMIIKKGDYEGYTTIQVRAGLNGTFNVGLSAPEGYLVSNHTAASATCAGTTGCVGSTTSSLTPVRITTVPTKFLDDKSARLDMLPILATGNNELVGIMHLEDSSGYPVIASRDLQIEVDSSDPNYLSISPVRMNQGDADVPVFGKTGNTAPPSTAQGVSSSVSLHVVTYNDVTVQAAMNASSINSFKLIADPLVSKIQSQSDFPLALYLVDSSGALTYFPSDYTPTVLPNDYFQVESKKISNGDSVDLFNVKSLKDGPTTLNIIVGSYPTSVSLSSTSSSLASIDLDYPNTLVSNSSNLMEMQVFDSNSNPRYLNEDTNMKLVSSNDSVILFPPNITISKGSYYSSFEVAPKSPGSATVSVVADNLPLATYNVRVEDMAPTLTVNSSATALPGETLVANVKAERYARPLSGMNVDWQVSGASIQSSDKTTNKDGVASIVLTSGSSGVVSLTSSVSGLGFAPAELKDVIKINSTQAVTNSTNSTSGSSVTPSNLKPFKINGIDPLPFAVVGIIAAGGIMMKKKNIRLFKKNSSNTNNVRK
ncbi:MAG: Ig-like domain-containing protein [Thaumarchaeota archaeon]|nr:Ig-like domain-containing protein [Nitrososphaerota archaeon]